MSLKGKAALVTGSTSGIGLGIARELAKAGADMMLNGFGDPAAIQALRAELAQSAGVKVAFNGADLSKPDAVVGLVQATTAELGRLDILVNNAGIQHTSPIASFPPEKWDAVIAINLSAAFHAMRAAIPGMQKAGWGRIINIASAHGLVASEEKSAYVAAKHGIVGLTKVGALELANSGVTVNAICPGWVLTPLVQAQIDARAKKEGIPADQVARELL
ncbi:MAG TPA: 3-hydroxybutyrate dehydrogenase, partial [Acetobacteraceae bacterium]|nr:3-hydroxybutyrate dehydrogenase [Acetobacteraceae bacterium]